MASKIRGSLDKAKRFILALEVTTGEANAERAYYFANRELGNLSLNRLETIQFFECINDIYYSLNNEFIDRNSIQSWFQIAILKSLDLKGLSDIPRRLRTDEAMAEFSEKINGQPSKWVVYIPVEGLSLQGLPVRVGNVLFRPGNQSLEKRIRSEMNQVMAISPDSQEVKYDFRQGVMDSFNEHWKARPVAQISVLVVTENAAHAKALRLLQSTIDTVNFFADITFKTGNGGRIYLPGETSRGRTFSMCCNFSEDGACVGNNVKQYLIGSFSSFVLSKDSVKELNKYGFREACTLLKKENKSEWDDRVLSALQWAGRATSNKIVNERIAEETGARREESFMLYAIALESLLVNKGSEITYKFAIRGAHIVQKDIEAKKRARKRLLELYGLRSRVVHSGMTEITEEDLFDMAKYARTAIMRVLKTREFRDFQKWAEFDDWVEEKMLS